MSSISLVVNSQLDGTVTLSAAESPLSGEGGNTRKFNAANSNTIALNGTSTPKVDVAPIDLSFTLVGITKTWDLTSVPDAREVSSLLDMTGNKLVAIKFKANKNNNTAGLEIAQGAANPYFLFGTTGDKVTLFPGMDVLYSYVDNGVQHPAVAAGAKDILFTGAIGDVVLAIAYFQT